MRLGLYAVLKVFRKLFNKSEAQRYSRKRKALLDGFKRMKLETERSLRMQFRDYQENIKFQYLFRLTDGLVRQLNEDLVERFQSYFADTAGLITLVREEHEDKERLKLELGEIGETARKLSDRFGRLRAEIHASMDP